MSRPESKLKMGYYPLENHQWAAVASLFKFNVGTRALDPFAGGNDADNGGHFFHAFCQQHRLDGYVNELDTARANSLIPLFGETHVVNGAAEYLSTPHGAYPFIWANPPYDHDDVESRRLELNLLGEAWDWATPGGYVVWCVYKQHLTDYAAGWLSSRVSSADVYALPGDHLGMYQQIIVVCQKTTRTRTTEEKVAMVEHLQAQREAVPTLVAMDEPRYVVPSNPAVRDFHFTSKGMDMEKILRVLSSGNATTAGAFQERIMPAPVFKRQRAITPPRPGHTALMIGSGILNGITLETEEYGRVILMADKRRVESQVREEYLEGDASDKHIITVRENTQVTLRLMAENGAIIAFEGDEQVLPFVAKHAETFTAEILKAFDPVYKFDYGQYRQQLNAVRLGDKRQFKLYHSQKHVIAAILEAFNHMPGVLLSAAMGSGKTAISSTAMFLMATELAKRNTGKGDVTVLVCPPHLVEKWPRELSWQGDVLVIRVDDISDMKMAIRRINEAPRSTRKVLLIKRSVAALGQGFEPAVRWKTELLTGRDTEGNRFRERVACCPNCGHEMRDKEGDPIAEIQFNNKKWSCPRCHSPLWQDRRTPAFGEGTKAKKGSENRKFLMLGAELGREGQHVLTLPDVIPAESKGKYESRGTYRQRLDQVIQRMLKGRIGLLIWDEIHEAQTEDSGVGQAFSRIAGAAHKILGLTGTPMNGKSTSVYNLEYAINPETRRLFPRGGSRRLLKSKMGTSMALVGPKVKKDGSLNDMRRSEIFQEVDADYEDSGDIGSDSLRRWVSVMGVRESKITTTFQRHEMTGQLTGTTTTRRTAGEEGPGITADLVAFMMPHTITMSLRDLNKWLPKFSEVTEAIPLDDGIEVLYKGIMENVKQYMGKQRFQPGGSAGVMSSYLQWAMSWPNNPRAERSITDSIRNKKTLEKKKFLVALAPALEVGYTSKERRLIELVREDRAAGRRTIVFVDQTQTNDVQPFLAAMLEKEVEGAKPFILRSSTDTAKREAIIQKAVDDGYNILICQPKLVETGLDLVQFQHIIVHEIIYEIRVLMQATKRCWRLNQLAPECKVTYLYYAGTMEQAAMDLMSRKSRAMKMLLGDLGMTGFDALTAGEDALNMEQMLVKALANTAQSIQMEHTARKAESADMTAVDVSDALFWNVNEWLSMEDDAAEEVPVLVEEISAAPEPLSGYAPEVNEAALNIMRRALDALRAKKIVAPQIVVPEGRDWTRLTLL